jgi:hypothetical protein
MIHMRGQRRECLGQGIPCEFVPKKSEINLSITNPQDYYVGAQ